MSDSPNVTTTEMVTITVDGKEIRVPKGMNLIAAAAQAGVEIPHYCYHPHLSIAGNCRMCQVQIEGQPKLTIACNTTAADKMVVRTQHTSKDVAEAQRATLEFLLINHPLDCTVCDQAGHCKLQDYYYEYNHKASRFIEDKEHKVKAEILGPEIIYDGERCIVCTRCVRFCDEVTGTSELGVINRGDKAVIAIHPDKPIDNPLSGSVVDLCPVGALTHRRWRFNTRIWYTAENHSTCPGCSTGCSVKVATRDNQIVHVKARLNSAVNDEWLCDEGRYGFNRFQPEFRLNKPTIRKSGILSESSWDESLKVASGLKGDAAATDGAVFISPFLPLEEVWLALQFAEKVMGVSAVSGRVAMALKQRDLSETEAVLISPDYAPNARSGALFGLGGESGDWRAGIEGRYQSLLKLVRAGGIKRLLFVGDFSLLDSDLDSAFETAVSQAIVSVALTPRGVATTNGVNSGADKFHSRVHTLCSVNLPSRTVNEKSGVLLNRDLRFQRLGLLLNADFGSFPEWMLLRRMAAAAGRPILSDEIADDRALFREVTKQLPALGGLTLARIGELGIALDEIAKAGESAGASAAAQQG